MKYALHCFHTAFTLHSHYIHIEFTLHYIYDWFVSHLQELNGGWAEGIPCDNTEGHPSDQEG